MSHGNVLQACQTGYNYDETHWRVTRAGISKRRVGCLRHGSSRTEPVCICLSVDSNASTPIAARQPRCKFRTPCAYCSSICILTRQHQNTPCMHCIPVSAAIFLRRVRATRALPRNPASNSKPQPQACSQHEPPAGPPLCRVARSCETVDQNLRRVWRCMDQNRRLGRVPPTASQCAH